MEILPEFIFVRQNRIVNLPIYVQRFIVPNQALLRLFVVKSCTLVAKYGIVFQCQKSVSKSLRDEKHIFLFVIKSHLNISSVCGRTSANIDRKVKNASFDNPQ